MKQEFSLESRANRKRDGITLKLELLRRWWWAGPGKGFWSGARKR